MPDHAATPPVGLADVRSSPKKPEATQRLSLGHETSVIQPKEPIASFVHLLAPPTGSFVTYSSVLPPVTQRESEAHEIAFRYEAPSSSVADHSEAEPAGFVDVKTLPPESSVAAQNELDGHETEARVGLPLSGSDTCHAPDVGTVLVMT